MSFVVRQISHAADGREIVRSNRIDAPRITIGRDAGCDIHLADLAVDLQHAAIEDNGRALHLSSLSGLAFEVDGKRVTRADVDPGTGAELRIGGHQLRIGKDGEDVTIGVERIAAFSDTMEEKDVTKLFTLRGKLPGRRISAWLLTLAVLAAFLLLPIYAYQNYRHIDERPRGLHADRSWSSGPLSLAHKQLSNDCQACHKDAFVAVRDTACLTCHKEVHDHADPARLQSARGSPQGFAGWLRRIGTAFNRPAGRCVECHTEHDGAGPMPKTAQVFCTNCHKDLNTRLPDTKIGNAGDFGTAHPEFQPLVALQPGPQPERQRVSLDQRPTDDSGLKFSHSEHLSGTNGVARMAQTLRDRYGRALTCADCHTSTADGVRFLPVTMERSCSACHSLGIERIGDTVRTLRHGDPRQVVADLRAFYRSTSPARPINLSGNARRPGAYAEGQVYHAYFAALGTRAGRADGAIRQVFAPNGTCGECHTVFAPPPGSDNWQVLPVRQTSRYLMKGWFDHAAHKTEKCASCHNATASRDARDLLIPGIKTCRNCHAGEGAHFADVPSPCAMCHSYHALPGAPWVTRRAIETIRPPARGAPPVMQRGT